MTVDNDFKWKKLGLTSMQEKKNLDILNDCSGKERTKKILHTSKMIRPNYGLFFPLFVVKKPHQSCKRYCGGDIWTQLLGLKIEVSAKVP